MSRATKLTPDVHTLVVQLLGAGNYIETAAAAAGVSSSTMRDWLRRGARARSGIYRELHEAVNKATAEAEAKDVIRISKAASSGEWRAAAWKLERRYPERFGQKLTVEAKGEAASQILALLKSEVSASAYAEIVAALSPVDD